MSFLDSYRLRLETLGPIHVGTGEAFPAYSYLLDEKNKQALILDAGQLLELLSPQQQEDYLKAVEDGPKRAQEKLHSLWSNGLVDPTPAILRRVPVSNAFIQTVKNATDAAGLEFRPLPRSPLGSYLPGSSIKGALRTAWLYYQVGSATNDILFSSRYGWYRGDKVEDGVAPLVEFPQKVRPINAQDFEKFVLGYQGTYDDPFRAVRVSDSPAFESSRLERIGVFHPKNLTQGVVILSEVIPEGTILTVNFSYHKGLSKQRGVAAPIPPAELAEACRVYFQEVLEVEQNYAQKFQLEQANALYERLRVLLDNNTDYFPLRIGFGSGKLSLTLALLEGRFNRQTHLLEPVDNNPKTRKTVGSSTPKDGFPLGWAIARLEPY